MRSVRIRLSLALVVFLHLPLAAVAQSYKVAIGDIGGTEQLVKLTRAMGAQLKVQVDAQLFPMGRMVHSVVSKQCDLGAPIIALKSPEKVEHLPFDYSTEPIHQMAFVLYTNKSKPVDAAELKSGNTKGYSIETDVSSVDMLGFALLPSTNVEASLRKVNDGKIDGFVIAQISADPVLKQAKLPNVKRQLFDTFDIVFALQKGARGGPVDKFVSDGLRKTKESGEFDKLLGMNVKMGAYEEWQP